MDLDVSPGAINKEHVVYFELSGGNFCPPTRKCYGYLVTTNSTVDPKRFGAVIAQDPNSPKPVVFQMPRLTGPLLETGQQINLGFLKGVGVGGPAKPAEDAPGTFSRAKGTKRKRPGPLGANASKKAAVHPSLANAGNTVTATAARSPEEVTRQMHLDRLMGPKTPPSILVKNVHFIYACKSFLLVDHEKFTLFQVYS